MFGYVSCTYSSRSTFCLYVRITTRFTNYPYDDPHGHLCHALSFLSVLLLLLFFADHLTVTIDQKYDTREQSTNKHCLS